MRQRLSECTPTRVDYHVVGSIVYTNIKVGAFDWKKDSWNEWSSNDDAGDNDASPSPISSLSPVLQPTIALTKNQYRVLDIANTHLTKLQTLSIARGAGGDTKGYLAIDIEKNERGPEILEVGLAHVLASDSFFLLAINARHLVVEDHNKINNHRTGYNQKLNFNFGVLEMVQESMLASRIDEIVVELGCARDDVVRIGHSIHNDIAWLKTAGVELGLDVCDIGKAYQAKKQSIQSIGLYTMMDELLVGYENLHNGGNDAYYTLEVFLRMLEVEDMGRQNKSEQDSLL